jgi:hypothetical protein
MAAADTAGDRPNFPDLEASLLSEHWESVIAYADLCTISPEDAAVLASEAFTRTLREAPPWSAPHFAWLPRLLIAVRNTAADWQAEGYAHLLAPGLQLWLQTDEADAPSAAPHGFQDMPEPDKSLLWHSQVEARPIADSAAALGFDTDRAAAEIARTRELFRESCLRVRLHNLVRDEARECRGYAKLLDVATRDTDAVCPPDLSRHLATCADCAATAEAYALHGDRLALTLADGVLGWAGTAYLRRRHAAAVAPPALPPAPHAVRRRVGLTAAALAVPALVLLAILAPSSNAPTSNASAPAPITATAFPSFPDPTTASPRPPLPVSDAVAAGATRLTAVPSPTPSKTKAPTKSASPSHTPAPCTARYRLVNQWDGGFQAEVELTSRTALNGWRVDWDYPDGQHITQIWDATVHRPGPRVTVNQASYNASIPAGQQLAFGFLGSWYYSNGSPSAISLNGAACDVG